MVEIEKQGLIQMLGINTNKTKKKKVGIVLGIAQLHKKNTTTRFPDVVVCVRGLCYLPQPSASADNTDLGFDNS